MKREQLNIVILAAGIIFLVFYWTHSAFVSAQESALSSTATVQEKIEKALELQMKAARTDGMSKHLDSGLFSFIEDTAQKTGTAERLGGMKPKPTEGSEAASFRLDSLTHNEAVEFIKQMEQHTNIRLTAVKINKRFDNEKRLNLYIEAEKL